MRRHLIVGIGSPFEADTLGWEVLDALPRQELVRPGCELRLVKADRPGVGLLEMLAESDTAVLIDALLDDAPQAPVRLLEPAELARRGAPFSSHALGVAEVLALGERLDMLPPELWIIGVASPSWDPGTVTELLQRLLPGRQAAGTVAGRAATSSAPGSSTSGTC